jgi:dTDP-glucose 4,6-dehydratase
MLAVIDGGTPGESYMVGGNSERTNLQVVETICAALDTLRPRDDGIAYAEQITFVTDRPGHDFRYAIDASKLKDQLGWEPAETFESGMTKTIKWYLDNETWWHDILSGDYRGERLGTGE